MANSVSNVGFTDYGVEQQAIARRQKLAEALQAQGMSPIEQSQTPPGGFTQKISPWQGIAKMAQAYAGALGNSMADRQQKTLASRYQTDLADVLRRGTQAQSGTPAQTIQPDPQEAQQSADYGTPQVGPANTPAQPPNMGEASSIYMSHPATQGMGMQLAQQQTQRQALLSAMQSSQGQPTGNPMVPGANSSVMAGGGETPAQGSPAQTGFGSPAGGTPMEVWLQIDPSGKAYAEALAKDRVTPYQQAQLSQGERHFNGVSGNTQASLTQARDLHNTPTPFQLAELGNQRTGLKIRATEADPFGTLGLRDNVPQGPGGAPSGGGQPVSQPLAGGNVHGEEYLKTLPAQLREQVKALSEGRMSFPQGYALRSPQMQQLIQAVSQYDPTFDAVNYNSRSKVRADFTSGQSSRQINAMNTVMGHLQSLSDAADKLNNTASPGYNKVANWLSQQTGDPRMQEFGATRKAVVDELTRVWRGNGGSEGDIKSWSDQINAAGSPAQLHGVIGQIAELIESKIGAMGSQYQQGMGTANQPMQLITPKSQQVLTTLRSRAGGGGYSGPERRVAEGDPLGIRR